MITVGENSYTLLLQEEYDLSDLVESITLEDSIDEVALHAVVKLRVVAGMPKIETGMHCRLRGTLFGTSTVGDLVGSPILPAVIWDLEVEYRSSGKSITLSIFDASIYLTKCEDEYLFSTRQTASQRLKRYLKDWNVPVDTVADTKVVLAKAVYRAHPIWSFIMDDLKETARKGGDVFRPRVTGKGLSLLKLGSNKDIWVFAVGENIEETGRKESMEDAVTQVKVLGKQSEDTRSPVLAIVKGSNIRKYGTIQKVLQDSKVEKAGEAKTAASRMLSGPGRNQTVQGPDVNTLRAGDKLVLSDEEVYAYSVQHTLGSPGKISLQVASLDYIRRKNYAYGSV